MRIHCDPSINTVKTPLSSHTQDDVCKAFDKLITTKVETTPLLLVTSGGVDNASLGDRKTYFVDLPASLKSTETPVEASTADSTSTKLDINQNIKATQKLYLDLLRDQSEKISELSSSDEERCHQLMSGVQSQWMDEVEEQSQTKEKVVEQLMLLQVAVREFNDFITESSIQQKREAKQGFVKKNKLSLQPVKQKKVKHKDMELKQKKLQQIADLATSNTSGKNEALVLLNEYMIEQTSNLRPLSSAVQCLAKWSALTNGPLKDIYYYSNLLNLFESHDENIKLTDEQLMEKLVNLDSALLLLDELKESRKATQLLCTMPDATLKNQEHLVHLILKVMTCDNHWPPGKDELEIFDKLSGYISDYSAANQKQSDDLSYMESVYHSFMQILGFFFDRPDLMKSILSKVANPHEAYAMASGYDEYLLKSGKKRIITQHSNKIYEIRKSNRFESIPGENELSSAADSVSFFESLTKNREKELEKLKRESLDRVFGIIRQEALNGFIQNRLDGTIVGRVKGLFKGLRVKLLNNGKVVRHKRIEQEINDIFKGYACVKIENNGDEFLLNFTKEKFDSVNDEELTLNKFLGNISFIKKKFDNIKDALVQKNMTSNSELKFNTCDRETLTNLIRSISNANRKIVDGCQASKDFSDDTNLKLEILKKERDVAINIKIHNQDMITVINKILERKKNAQIESMKKEIICKKRNKGFRKYIPRATRKVMKRAGFVSNKHYEPDVSGIKISGTSWLIGLRNRIKIMDMSKISAIDYCLKDCQEIVESNMNSDADENAIYYKILLRYLANSKKILKDSSLDLSDLNLS